MVMLITGSNRGLGLELVKEGLKRGHRIIATSRTPGSDLPGLRGSHGESLELQEMDVTSPSSIRAAYDSVITRHHAIDGILNNAAVLLETKTFTGDPIVEVDLDKLLRTFDVNTFGPVRVMKQFMPLLYRGRNRCIVNITTEGAQLHGEGSHYIAYCASKIALNLYTQKIRNYLAATEGSADIRVYMIHPGRMFTVMGVENAQIQPSEPAFGIWDIIEGKTRVDLRIPFVDFKGREMSR